jgi:hypothetical protein
MEKLFAFLRKAKQLLSKDYSMQDLKNLKNLKSLPKTLQQKFSEVQSGLSKTSSSSELVSSSVSKFDIKQLPSLARQFVKEQRSLFILFLAALFLLLLNAFVIAPYGQKIQDQLDMRPSQWSQLQSLIKLAKSSSISSPSPSYASGVATVTLLDDMELQKIRGVLTTRGLKPNVLRLTADNPPRIEFQSSDAMFSVLLDALDELRTTWRLYPEQLNVVSSAGAGVVNISGVLVQHGGQAGMAR